jgi:hypothetical protein
MTMRALLPLSLFALTALSACAGGRPSGQRVETGPREPIDLRDEDDACGATLVQGLIGLRANDVVRRDVADRSRAAVVRWVEPGMAVTMDFRADRLTGEINEDGAVASLRCG